MEKLLLSQRVGLWWFRVFDSGGFIFKALSKVPKLWRIYFYSILVIAWSASIFWLAWFSEVYLASENLSDRLILLNRSFFFFIALSVLPVVFYEKIFNFGIDGVRSENKKIKMDKSGWWRLRNMRFWIRLLIYGLFGSVIALFLPFIAVDFVMSATDMFIYDNVNMTIAFRDGVTAEMFSSAVSKVTSYLIAPFLLIFLFFIGVLEFFVRRKIKKSVVSAV